MTHDEIISLVDDLDTMDRETTEYEADFLDGLLTQIELGIMLELDGATKTQLLYMKQKYL